MALSFLKHDITNMNIHNFAWKVILYSELSSKSIMDNLIFRKGYVEIKTARNFKSNFKMLIN